MSNNGSLVSVGSPEDYHPPEPDPHQGHHHYGFKDDYNDGSGDDGSESQSSVDSNTKTLMEEGREKESLVRLSVHQYADILTAAVTEARYQTSQGDACLIAQNEEFLVHSIIVSAFSKKLREGLSNKYPKVLQIDGVKPDELNHLLNFMYCNLVCIKQSRLLRFLKAADILEIEALQTPALLKLQKELEGRRWSDDDDDEPTLRDGFKPAANEPSEPTVKLPPSISVFRVQDGKKIEDVPTLSRDKLKEEPRKDSTEKEAKKGCCCSCKKGCHEKESEEEKKDEKEKEVAAGKETIAMKLEKMGTRISGAGSSSLLDLPHWVLASGNISVTPIAPKPKITPVKQSPSVLPKTPSTLRTPPTPKTPITQQALPKYSENVSSHPVHRKNLAQSLGDPRMQTSASSAQMRQSPHYASPSAKNPTQPSLKKQPVYTQQKPMTKAMYTQQQQMMLEQEVLNKRAAQYQSGSPANKRGKPPIRNNIQTQASPKPFQESLKGTPHKYDPTNMSNYSSPTSSISPYGLPTCSSSPILGSSKHYELSNVPRENLSASRGLYAQRGRGRPYLLRGNSTPVKVYSSPQKINNPNIRQLTPFPHSGAPLYTKHNNNEVLWDGKEPLEIKDLGITINLQDSAAEVIENAINNKQELGSEDLAGSTTNLPNIENTDNTAGNMTEAHDDDNTPQNITEAYGNGNFSQNTPDIHSNGNTQNTTEVPVGENTALVPPVTQESDAAPDLNQGKNNNSHLSNQPRVVLERLEEVSPNHNEVKPHVQDSQDGGSDKSLTEETGSPDRNCDNVDNSSETTVAAVDKMAAANAPKAGKKRGRPSLPRRELPGPSCPVCDKKFSALCELQMHMRIHSNSKFYCCCSCNFSGSTVKTLNTHISKVHRRKTTAAEKKGLFLPTFKPNDKDFLHKKKGDTEENNEKGGCTAEEAMEPPKKVKKEGYTEGMVPPKMVKKEGGTEDSIVPPKKVKKEGAIEEGMTKEGDAGEGTEPICSDHKVSSKTKEDISTVERRGNGKSSDHTAQSSLSESMVGESGKDLKQASDKSKGRGSKNVVDVRPFRGLSMAGKGDKDSIESDTHSKHERKDSGDKATYSKRERKESGDKATYSKHERKDSGDKATYSKHERKNSGDKATYSKHERKNSGDKATYSKHERKDSGDKATYSKHERKDSGDKATYSKHERKDSGDKATYSKHERKDSGDKATYSKREKKQSKGCDSGDDEDKDSSFVGFTLFEELKEDTGNRDGSEEGKLMEAKHN